MKNFRILSWIVRVEVTIVSLFLIYRLIDNRQSNSVDDKNLVFWYFAIFTLALSILIIYTSFKNHSQGVTAFALSSLILILLFLWKAIAHSITYFENLAMLFLLLPMVTFDLLQLQSLTKKRK